MATNGLSLHLQDDDIDVSMYALGELMEDFSHAYFPLVDSLYGISSLKLRTALQQIFVLLFSKNGCGPGETFGARGHLGLSSSKPRRVTRREETSKETLRTVEPVQEKQRQVRIHAFTTGHIGSSP